MLSASSGEYAMTNDLMTKRMETTDQRMPALALVVGIWSLRFKSFDSLGESTLGTSGCVSVNHALGGSLIEFFGGQKECRFAFFNIARRNSSANLANLTANHRLYGTVSSIAGNVLAEAFFGTFGIGHVVSTVNTLGRNSRRVTLAATMIPDGIRQK